MEMIRDFSRRPAEGRNRGGVAGQACLGRTGEARGTPSKVGASAGVFTPGPLSL